MPTLVQPAAPHREILRIQNFGGLTDAEIEFSRLNIFIGPQASGKSIAAKLFYFFRSMIGSIEFEIFAQTTTNPALRQPAVRFLDYFPVSAWPDGGFQIRYSFGPLWFEISRDSLSSDLVSVRESGYVEEFLAAGRRIAGSGPTNRQNVDIRSVQDALAQLIGVEIDPRVANGMVFLVESRGYFSAQTRLAMSRHEIPDDFFALEYDVAIESVPGYALRQFDNPRLSPILRRLLRGTYAPGTPVPSIIAADGRKTLQWYWASGQKSAVPLAFAILATAVNPLTLVIEEPEVHLYPTGQHEIARLVSGCGGLATQAGRPQYVMTTHSPYLLTAFNNLVYAGKIVRDKPETKAQVERVLDGIPVIDPRNLRAYAFEGGEVRTIVDPESGLISANELDKTSTDLGVEFEQLMDIEFQDSAA